MKITSAQFLCSNPGVETCPAPVFPEYAFCGRSNVGKSSLINMITEKKGLAKTSSTPGKTALINHFLVNGSWYLTDLPGYGFAKISKESKNKWKKMIFDYLLKRENLMCLFLLIDSRHEPQANDLNVISFLAGSEIPFVIVFTKSDKLTKNQLRSNLALYEKELMKKWEVLPEIVISSAENNTGRSEILELIGKTNKLFIKNFSEQNKHE